MPGGREALRRADNASSNSESVWLAPSHYWSLIWTQASIFINGDLENRSKELLPSKTKRTEGVKYRNKVRNLCGS